MWERLKDFRQRRTLKKHRKRAVADMVRKIAELQWQEVSISLASLDDPASFDQNFVDPPSRRGEDE